MTKWWLTPQLRSEDPVKRMVAIQKLAKNRDFSVIDKLATAMDDRHPDVQDVAVDALASFGPDVIRPLLAAHSKNFFRVANKLGKDAIPVLLEDLKNDDPLVREQVASYLSGPEEMNKQLREIQEKAIAALATALHDSSEKVIWGAAYALSGIHLPACVPPLIDALADSRAIVRLAAIDALGRIGDQRAVQPLWSLRKDADRRVAYDAVSTAVALGGAAFYDQMIELAASPDQVFRRIAGLYLGSCGERALPTLFELIKDPESLVRAAAIDALGRMPSGRTIHALVDGLLEWQDPNIFNLSDPLNKALIRIGLDAMPQLLEFMKTAPPNSQLRAMRIISMLPGGAEAVRPYVNATDAKVRAVAWAIIERYERSMD